MNKNLNPRLQERLENLPSNKTIAMHFQRVGQFDIYLVAKRIDGKILWQIQEIVSKNGLWIIWDGLFEDLENALVVVEQTCHVQLVRDNIYA